MHQSLEDNVIESIRTGEAVKEFEAKAQQFCDLSLKEVVKRKIKKKLKQKWHSE